MVKKTVVDSTTDIFVTMDIIGPYRKVWMESEH